MTPYKVISPISVSSPSPSPSFYHNLSSSLLLFHAKKKRKNIHALQTVITSLCLHLLLLVLLLLLLLHHHLLLVLLLLIRRSFSFSYLLCINPSEGCAHSGGRISIIQCIYTRAPPACSSDECEFVYRKKGRERIAGGSDRKTGSNRDLWKERARKVREETLRDQDGARKDERRRHLKEKEWQDEGVPHEEGIGNVRVKMEV